MKRPKSGSFEGVVCCEQLKGFAFVGEDLLVDYYPPFREFGLPYRDGGSSIQMLEFCPWCGKKLPRQLRDSWFQIVHDELGFEDTWPSSNEIPGEFKSDVWWRRRGL